jgi:hypothetical protein
MKQFFSHLVAVVLLFLGTVVTRVAQPTPRWVSQGGFVLLSRPYGGYAAGTIVELPKSTEDTLIAAGQAVTSSGPPTPGAVTTTLSGGACAVAAAASSVVITNPLVTAQTLIYAAIAQAVADTTAFNVTRVVAANGSFTIFLNAATTAAVTVDWAILAPFGTLSSPT